MSSTTFEEYASNDGAYELHYDPAESDGVSMEIIETIATIKETPATELEPLGETIDSEALDRVIQSVDQAAFEFEYSGCRVVVCSEGGVVVLAD